MSRKKETAGRSADHTGVAEWQLPAGITRGTWDYFQHEPMAYDYDEYHAYNRLFEFDERILVERFDPQRSANGSFVVDLGAGTGRALVTLARRGFRGLAIDLSEHMLNVVREKASREQLAIDCLKANLVELDCLPNQCADYAISLFSTLGMIAGRANRQRALNHARRILKPGGLFVLHVHNYWYNLYDPGGPWWLLSNLFRATFSRDIDVGDKFFFYRGVPNMYLHVFRPSELRSELFSAGFRIREWIPLAAQRYQPLPAPWFLNSLRANGWIVVCE